MTVSIRLEVSSVRRLHSELREQQEALAHGASTVSHSSLSAVTQDVSDRTDAEVQLQSHRCCEYASLRMRYTYAFPI